MPLHLAQGPALLPVYALPAVLLRAWRLVQASRSFAVGTLLALAEASLAERASVLPRCPHGRVYHAAYEKSGDDWTEIDAPGLYKPFQVPPLTGAQWTGCRERLRRAW
jgi:hypothetical protein